MGQVLITTQRSVQNLHQISILSSIQSGLQYVCLYLVSSFVFISAKTEANYSEIPARSTCHESRGSAITWVEIALHNMTHRDWPVTSGLFLSCEKNAISNLACCRYDIGMSWQSQIFILCSFYHRRLVIPERAKQYSLTLRKYTCSFLFVFVTHICPDFYQIGKYRNALCNTFAIRSHAKHK